MDQTFFRKPFAVNGNKTDVPTDLQPDGSVSFDQGYGFDYERDPATDAQAKLIDRQPFNGLMYAITQQLFQTQAFSYAEWATPANNGGVQYAYAKHVFVRYRPNTSSPWVVYVSLVDANTATPGTDATKWQPILVQKATIPQAVAGTDDTTIITPATLMAALDNAFATRLPSRYGPGDFVMTMADSPPSGTMVMNGAAVSRTVYSALFARIGTKYGIGDGSTTFNLPNFNDGYAPTAANGTAVGTPSAGQVISHGHSASSLAAGDHTHSASSGGAGAHSHSGWTDAGGYHGHSGVTTAAGAHAHTIGAGTSDFPAGGYVNSDQWADTSVTTNPVGDHQHGLSIDGAGSHSHGVGTYGVGDHAHSIGVANNGTHSHTISVGASGGAANLAASVRALFCIAF